MASLFRQEHPVGRNDILFHFIRSVGTDGTFNELQLFAVTAQDNTDAAIKYIYNHINYC